MLNNQTRDFYLAAFLVAKGVKLQSHSKTNGTTLFVFADDKLTNDNIEDYYTMSGSIEPITYANAIKALKSIVHSYDKANTNSEENHNEQKGKQ
jgi:hypothetical protein